jgi:hypothetical protein
MTIVGRPDAGADLSEPATSATSPSAAAVGGVIAAVLVVAAAVCAVAATLKRPGSLAHRAHRADGQDVDSGVGSETGQSDLVAASITLGEVRAGIGGLASEASEL